MDRVQIAIPVRGFGETSRSDRQMVDTVDRRFYRAFDVRGRTRIYMFPDTICIAGVVVGLRKVVL